MSFNVTFILTVIIEYKKKTFDYAKRKRIGNQLNKQALTVILQKKTKNKLRTQTPNLRNTKTNRN